MGGTMTDGQIVDIARALLFEAGTGVQAETLRRGATPDDAAIAQVAAAAVRNTLALFHREERALDERELGVFLVAVVAITLNALLTMHATASAIVADSTATLAQAASRLERLQAAPAPAGAAAPPAA